jgi:hypothetical protein
MDPDLLEWLSYDELQELETDNLIAELQAKLTASEKFNIEQIILNQSQSKELIKEIDKADQDLELLSKHIQSHLDKVQDLRHRAGPLEIENSQYIIEQKNIRALNDYIRLNSK